MAWFHNLRLRWKLFGAFGLLVVAVAIQGALVYQAVEANHRVAMREVHDLRDAALANRALLALVSVQNGYRGFLLTGAEEYLEPYDQGRRDAATAIAMLTGGAKADEATETSRWREVERRAASWQDDIALPGIDIRRSFDRGEARIDDVTAWASTRGGNPQFDAIRSTVEEALAAEEASPADLAAAHERPDSLLPRTLIGRTIATAAAAIVIGTLLSRSLAGAIGSLADAAEAVARGQLDHRLGLARRDEIGQTAAAFDHMAERLRTMVGEMERASRPPATEKRRSRPSSTAWARRSSRSTTRAPSSPSTGRPSASFSTAPSM